MNLNGKVIFLIPGFASDEGDQNCLPYLQDLMLLLKDKLGSDRMEIIAFQYPFQRSTYNWHGIQVHAMGGKNRKGISKLLTWIRVWTVLRNIQAKSTIGILHAFWLSETALIAQIFGFFHKVHSMVTIMGQDPLKSNKYLRLLKLRKFTLIGVSNFVSEELEKSSGHPADDVIPHVLKTENFANLPESEPSYDILGVGNLYPLKNYNLFIEIVEILVRDFPELKCGIAGSGAQHDDLLKLISAKKLDKNIELLGETQRSKVLAIMKNSTVFLHTSQYESQGFAMSEALYLGMKVVSTPVSDTESNDSIQCGKTPQELADCVRIALGNKTRECVVFYPAEKAVGKYLSHYMTFSK
ncbi:MAG TPA: hypothetical protein DCX54_11000 [Flavobacteriales bacterium]|nr:hypothetical protein [Flavobacteriales bacterium]